MNSFERHVIRMLDRFERNQHRNQEELLAEIDTLRTQVQQAVSVEASAVALIKGLSAKVEQLAALPATGNAEADLAAIKSEVLDLSNQLNTGTTDLVSAMTAVPEADVDQGGTVTQQGTVGG